MASTQIDIVGPPGSGEFGTTVIALPNGNIVVSDPGYDAGSVPDVGAVYLYDGATGALISTLTGSSANDRIGDGTIGLMLLPNGNYLVRSPNWDNGAAEDAGAVTWGSATSGVSGVISAANSLVGSSNNDRIGDGWDGWLMLLPNGNYLVRSPHWDNGEAEDAGAVTWGSATSGVSGPVSAANSLVGSTLGDLVGEMDVRILANSNYLVTAVDWDNGPVWNAGAVTWGSGTTGVSGVISAANSLVGSSNNDRIGLNYITELANGNYVVKSPYWDNGAVVDAGAATWGSGTTGISGVVSAANSLVGSTVNDNVGGVGIYAAGVTALANGNYLVRSPSWDNGAAWDAGAVTWGNGITGISGIVSAANSLVGSNAGDAVGQTSLLELKNGNFLVISGEWNHPNVTEQKGAVTWGNGMTGISGEVSDANSLVGMGVLSQDWIPLPYSPFGVGELANGNYVVSSPFWDNGAVLDAGAVTWGSGTSGVSGVISAANSLVGSTNGDGVGSGVKALANGNYVVGSSQWDDNLVADAGAVTWGSGTSGISGVVNAANSLVGSTSGDGVGSGVIALANGNYVVPSPAWDNGAAVDAGAVTWGNGTREITGTISAANSLVGNTSGDEVGHEITKLANGNYVVSSPLWDNGAAVDAGAVTWGSGVTGTSGAVSSANSLVGGSSNNSIGWFVTALVNGNYVVSSPNWDNGTAMEAGAVTWGSGTSGISGAVSAANSLVGSTSGDQIGGYSDVRGLTNGNFLVRSAYWDNGAAMDAGAVTWGNGTSGITGTISAANSLVGNTTNDYVGQVTELVNGNYVVSSTFWDNGAVADAGVVTWGSGTSGITGTVSAANSLVGNTTDDQVGTQILEWGFYGNYVVVSSLWDDNLVADAGAVTWGDGYWGTTIGSITADNGVRGTIAGSGQSMNIEFDEHNWQMVVGRPAENIVTLFRPGQPPYRTYLPLISSP